MTDGIRQFKINGKQVELSNEKKSASRDLYAQDAQLNSIFEKLNKADTNGNIDDVLDEKEIKDFQQKIIDAAGKDGDLSSEEAKSLLDSMGLKEIDTNKFFGFIQSMFSKEDAKVKEEVSDAAEEPQESEKVDEEQITRGVIVQNGESPAAIAKKFGVPLQDLLDVNKDALKGKGDKKYFLVGQEIVIPRKIDDEELATLNAGRKSAEETTGDYAQQAAIREQKAAEVRARKAQEEAELKELGMTERAKGEVKAHYSKTPDKTITFKKVANAKNGRSICVDKNGNYVVVAKDGTILKTDFVKNPEKYEQARKLNEEVKTRNTAKGIAKEFYQIADDNSGLNSINRMQKLLDTKVSAKNITQFLDEYDKFKQGDSSIIDTITSEVGASGTIQQKKVLTTLMDKLSQAARQAGVSEAEIKKANADFLKAYNVEYKSTSGAFRRTNPKDMEKAMDSLRGNILAKQNGTGDVDSAEAIKQFKDLARKEHNSAVKDFNKAREEEGWTAKVGDTVCGWFGCNTIEDLNKKLGANGAAVKKLINSKTEVEFKTNYKEIFGVEFDPNKISARQNAIEKYSFALNCDNTVKAADKVLKHSDSWGYSDIKTAIRNNFKYDNATIDQIIDKYAQSKGIQNPTDADKKTILVQFLNDTKTNARREFTNIAQGKSLDQMGKDIELITRSTFGTNDIVKDVIQFNENQQITEMVTEAGFEIAGTIALQFVPGLGQMAAARLALSAARWGTKAVKVVNYAQKAEKVFSTVNKFQKGQALANTTSKTARIVNKGVQVGMQMVNTGVATAGVDLSNGKSVKEATKKALMNMSFAGVGASSSILAPKLMQAFGIADKALATEIAEEIINAAGSYGVTKLEGGEYGSTDAFVDFASGLIISRISHVGGSKPTVKPQGATTPEVPTAQKVETPNTPAPKAKTETVKAEVKPNETPEVVIKPNPETKSEPVASTFKKDVVTVSETTKNNNAISEGIMFEPLTNETDISKYIKTLYPDVTEKELQEIYHTINILKNGENLTFINTLNGDVDLDITFINDIAGKIDSSKITYNNYKQAISKGKQITKMSNSELIDYYKKLVPYINEKELNCLTEQIHRINNGEPRYLGTSEEKELLESIYCKQWFGLRLKGIKPNRGFKTSGEFPNAGIKFVEKSLTPKQESDLRHWIDDGKNWALEDGTFDELSEALQNDTYLYRGVGNRFGGGYKVQTKFLNTIKEGAIIDNSNKFISTSQGVEYGSNYRNENHTAGTSYMLKIKVPKGTKVLDMRLQDKNFDEITLQPHKLKVVSIDYNSGIVECEYIPLKSEVETPVTTQPKYTKEFEPAHNDTPVSPEIIDQRLGADNPELHDMGEYYRDLETKEFEPHYEKREISAKTIDEQFENPELKKLNEEFASGNSMLQKQAAVENAIENLSYQNYSPEYVESIREKIKEISVGNPEMEKSYNELLDMAANDASTERASLIREKEYIERTYGTHKSAQESAQIFSDHLEQVNAAKEDDYIKRTHQNPSGKSAAESAEVFEKELAVRDKVKATDEQLHQKTVLDGDELFERITHSDNPELQQLGTQYKKLEAQQEELQQQVERLKEQIRRKAQTSASEIDSRFNRSNPELDIMNTKYRSLELQQEKLKAQVEKLKQQMREKVSVNADNIDSRLNQRTGDYEDLAADLRNREAIGQRAKQELELEKAEQAAAQREQSYIDKTYNTTHKSASESARVFEESFIKEQIQGIESAIDNINISKAGSLDIYTLKQQIDALTDTSLRNKYKQILDTKLASFDDNLTRQRTIKEKLEEYQKAYAADDAAYQKANDDGSYYNTKPKGFSYWASSDKVKRELDELLGYDKNSRATFYAEELLNASKTGYIDDGSIAYPFLASKTLSSTTPYEWKGMCHTIEFSKRIKSGEHINPYEVVDVLKNLDRPIYNQRIKDEIKNIYGLDLDSYRSSLVDWLDNEYSNSLTIQIPKEEKTKLVHNVLNNKKPISGTTAEIKSELEKAIPILKDNPKTEVIAKELKELENNPEFNKLDDLHKTIAKWSIITQDMRFRETAAVLREYNMPSVVQDRIIYSTIQDSQALAAAMMHSGDLEMFSIIDKVKRNIDTSYKGVNIEEIKSNIARINDVNNQNFIFSNTPATSAIPTQTVTNHGRNYNVKFVDLGDSKVLNNLEDYGFLPGTTPDDLEFVVHMFGHGKEEDNLTRLYNATKNKESVVLSTSLTNGYNRLYDHGNIGVVVDYNQNSVLDAFNEDLVSGRDKGHYQAQWAHKIWSDTSGRTKGQEYSLVKNELKNKLGLNDSEYLELTTYLRNKRSLGQITDIKIGDRKLSGTDIQKALKESQKKLFTGHEGYNEIELFNPSIKAIYLRDVEIADVPSYIFEYAQKHNLPIIHQPKMKNIITVQQAKLQCHDDNLIALATRKDGSVNKDALDVAMKYKELSGCNNDDIEFLLEQCNGNYKKVNDLMNKIQSELDRLDLEIRHGEIGIKGLKLGEFPDMDNQQFMKKYGSALNRGNKLINGCYRIDDLMHFYLFGKGKYIDSFNSGNIMKDLDIAYGCRSVTDGYHVRYTNILEKEDDIATLMAHSLSSQPTPDQRYALGRYKGDMSESIQEGRLPQDANYIDEFLSGNPLKKSINVKREDSYAILSNLKFADGVTLKDALTNPQYYDRLSQIKSLEGQSFINDRFMSTTVGNGAFGNSVVNWDFEVGEGVGATYLDILGLASEGELLLNRGLKVTITEIEDTTPKGVVHIKAKVEKAD